MDNNLNQTKPPPTVPQQPQVPAESFEPTKTPLPVTNNASPVISQKIEKPPTNNSKIILYILLVLIVLVTLVALGYIIFNFSQPKQPVGQTTQIPTVTTVAEEITPVEEDETQKLLNQGTSDEVSAIEKDLNDTNLTNLDKEVGDINNELSQP